MGHKASALATLLISFEEQSKDTTKTHPIKFCAILILETLNLSHMGKGQDAKKEKKKPKKDAKKK